MQIIQSGFLNERDRRALTSRAHGVASPCGVTRCAKAQVLLGSGWSRQQVRNAFLNITSGTSSGASSNWRRKKAFVEASDHAAFRAVLQPARESSRTALCGLMRKNATPTGCLTTRGKFADGTIDFLHGKAPGTGEECTRSVRAGNPAMSASQGSASRR